MSDLPTLQDDRPARQLRAMLVFAVALGLALRIAAAQGDYWLDEAWSAVFAREARTPGEVFFAINHDNNHFLNTLWLQLVGWGSPPMLGRTLSILCGTAAIVVAGLIGARRSLACAGGTALLFAIAPILVTYGSEARGYAPMLLALLCAIRIVDRELWGKPVAHAPIWIGVSALLGMLAHASMLFGIAALSGWVAIEQGRRLGWGAGALATLRLMGRAVAAAIAVLLIVAAGAAAGPDGFRMGSLAPFEWIAFVDALDHMIGWTIGWPLLIGPWLVFFLFLPLGLRRTAPLSERAPFHLLAILGLPLLVAVVQPDNSAFPRYYLLGAVALLLLVAELAATRGRAARFLFWAVVIGSLILDGRLIDNRRGDPGLAIDAMNERAPEGAGLILQAARDSAVLDAAATRRGYPLILADGCADDARFLYIADNGVEPFPLAALRCGAAFQPIAGRDVDGLSGQAWQLYERVKR